MEFWIYIDFNYTTEMWEVIKQTKGIENDEVLRSFKKEGNAHNYELTLTH